MRLNVPTPVSAVRRGRDSRRRAASASSTRSGWRTWDSIPLPTFTPPYEFAEQRAGARGALSADADLVAGASVPQFDVRERRRAAPRRARAGVSAPSRRRRAARRSPPARASWCTTIAARSRAVARVEDIDSRRASSGRRRSGGASSPPTARTRTRRRRSARPTSATARCSTTISSRWLADLPGRRY